MSLVSLNVAVSRTQVVVNRDSDDEVTVTCTVMGAFPSFVSWEKNGRTIKTVSTNTVHQEIINKNSTTRISVLLFRNVG